MKARTIVTVGLLGSLLLGARCSSGDRMVTYWGVLHLVGSGFGDGSQDGAHVTIRCPGRGLDTRIEAADPRVVTWRDDLIDVRGLDDLVQQGCNVRLPKRGRSVSGSSSLLVDEVRRWTSHPLQGGGPDFPLSIALAAEDGTVFLNPEFHRTIFRLAPVAEEALPVPLQPVSGVSELFTSIFETPTRMSTLGEKILVAPDGGVWFSEGGGYLYSGTQLNASRVNRFDPSTFETRCWNIPYNNAQVMGLHWEEEAGRMWAALSAYGESGAVVSFHPDSFSDEQTPCGHDFAVYTEESGYPAQSCGPGEYGGCFRLYPVPPETGGRQPAHLVMDPSGDLWVTSFFGQRLLRLDPETGVFTSYPLPASRGLSEHALLLGGAPWEIVLDAGGRDLFLTEFFDAQVLRFDIERSRSKDCTQLDAEGDNPCVVEYSVPVDTMKEFVHSLVRDGADTYYFTVSTGNSTEGDGRIGRLVVDNGSAEVLLFPPLATVVGSTEHDDAAGIALDPVTGDLVIANPWNRSIDRLRLVEPQEADPSPGSAP
jgi:streptogramin lyase